MYIIHKGIDILIKDNYIAIDGIPIILEDNITLDQLNTHIVDRVNTILNPNNTNTCPNCGSINNSIVLHQVHNQEPNGKVLRCFDCKNDYII